MTTRRDPRTPRSPACLLALLAMAGCGSGDDAAIDVSGPVAGEALAGSDVAVYLDVDGGVGDAIVGASSPAAPAATLHELEEVEGGGIMMPSDRIGLDGHTRLQPMGSHIMLSHLRWELTAGDRFALTLQFERHAPVEVEVEVVPLDALAELVEVDR